MSSGRPRRLSLVIYRLMLMRLVAGPPGSPTGSGLWIEVDATLAGGGNA